MWSGCQVFSGERAAVLLTLMLTCVRGKNAAAQACLNVGPTVISPVGLNDSTWHKNDNAIECWKPWSNGQAIQLAWAVLFLRLGWEENGQVELRWGEPTRVQRRWEEKREMKRELRRVKKMCTEMRIVEKRWREVRSRWKSWDVASQFATRGQKSRKRAWKSAAAPIGKPCFWIL